MNYSKNLLLSTILIFGSLLSDAQVVASYNTLGKCQNQPVRFISTSITPTGNITKAHWDFGTGVASDTALGDTVYFTYTKSGTYFVTLTADNNAGLSDNTTDPLTIDATPISAIRTTVRCSPDDIDLQDITNIDAGFIATRRWDVAGLTNTNSSFIFTPSGPGSYPVRFIGTSEKGCSDTITETLEYTTKPKLSFTPNSPITLCGDDPVSVTVSGAVNFVWEDNSENATIEIQDAGIYTVRGYTGNACWTDESVTINRVAKPQVDAGSDITIRRGENTTLLGSGGSNYTWDPSTGLSDPFSPNPVASPTTTTKYFLTGTDMNGCSNLDSIVVTIDAESSIQIHNMLTPNGDGYNDVWDLSNVPNIEQANIHVFNRWGWEVFKSDDYKNDWKGTFNDEPLPDGSYVYVIELKDDSTPLKGIVEIISNTLK